MGRRLAPDRLYPREEISSGRWLGGHDHGNNLILLHFFTGGDPTQNFAPLLRDLLHTGGFHRARIIHGSLRNKLANPRRRENPLERLVMGVARYVAQSLRELEGKKYVILWDPFMGSRERDRYQEDVKLGQVPLEPISNGSGEARDHQWSAMRMGHQD